MTTDTRGTGFSTLSGYTSTATDGVIYGIGFFEIPANPVTNANLKKKRKVSKRKQIVMNLTNKAGYKARKEFWK